MKTKSKILLIADVPDWIFARHCQTLSRLLADEFDFTTKYRGDDYSESDYDLIYPLEFTLAEKAPKQPAKYVTGIRSYTTWRDLDFKKFIDNLNANFQQVHAVSKRLESMFKPFLPNLSYVSHGVDSRFFQASRPPRQKSVQLTIGWAGNRNNLAKGFEHFIAPLASIKGIDLVFCGYDSHNLSAAKMKTFYEQIDTYVCSSDSEGNSSSLMEAAAMQRSIITTDVGTVPEYLIHGRSALIVERELPGFIEAVTKLRDNPQLRVALGQRARRSVQQKFDWDDKAEDYRRFFRQALAGRASWRPPKPLLANLPKTSNGHNGQRSKYGGSRYYRLQIDQARLEDKDRQIEKLNQANQRISQQLESVLGSKRWQLVSRLAKAKPARRKRRL